MELPKNPKIGNIILRLISSLSHRKVKIDSSKVTPNLNRFKTSNVATSENISLIKTKM